MSNMVILTSEQTREADAYTIASEPIASIDLMERTATACTRELLRLIDIRTTVNVFCGMGNNGGDGLVIARQLLESGYDVKTFIVRFKPSMSDDAQVNLERLEALDADISMIDSAATLTIPGNTVLIDAILGSGLTRPVSGLVHDVITLMNDSGSTIYSIDIPSGMFGEDNSSVSDDLAIHADRVLCLQAPKLSVLLPENAVFAQRIDVVNIGLHPRFLEAVASPYRYIDEALARSIYRTRSKFSHKGTYGHPMIIAGQKGMLGAALLSAEAAMRSGTGLVTLHTPQCGYEVAQCRLPEALVELNEGIDYLTSAPNINERIVAIGPGIGTASETAAMLRSLLQQSPKGIVIDADAINMLSDDPELIDRLPHGCILTPHPKEFERMVGRWENDVDKLEKLRTLSSRIDGIVILKGAHTAICSPDGVIHFNSTGNSGMATGGSGDVLTGMVTGLLAQGYSNLEASILGTYIHGYAGDLVSGVNGEEYLIAGDIIKKLGSAFTSLYPET